MKLDSRHSLIGAFALSAVLAAPFAFAQSADASAQSAQTDPAAQQTQAPPTGSAAPAAGASEPQKKSWNDVDADKNGTLSKTEAASVPALGQVFDQADADADGALTPDEYKAYVAQVQGQQGQGQQQDGGGR
ncbi:EF-hand domain-containing protein [Vulcaniibacterium tengchongense]|uniref:EF hand domain-containing protein n=1 Tax=Vulcaniibacterium tengchongense TaxID=1273429 RepID=A0A3N4VD16_9GAMM|nr:EF-hand domain-containing protein [Vulcaniibacterium tengchongense]RPE79693.1 EF hand domain-containing protein [Vulcaniibacterium tengchongense]